MMTYFESRFRKISEGKRNLHLFGQDQPYEFLGVDVKRVLNMDNNIGI